MLKLLLVIINSKVTENLLLPYGVASPVSGQTIVDSLVGGCNLMPDGEDTEDFEAKTTYKFDYVSNPSFRRKIVTKESILIFSVFGAFYE